MQLWGVMLFRFIFAFFLYFPTLLFADQLIIEPEMGRTPIIQAINQSQHTAKLVMYGYTEKPLVNALIYKHKNGTDVKVILEEHPFRTTNLNKKTIAQFKRHQVAWHGHVYPYRFIHQKTLIIDNKLAVVMTFNLTHSTFQDQRNFGLIIDDPEEIAEINNVFNADWEQRAVSVSHPNLIWSPNNSREKLLSLIDNAKHSIRVYAQSITDKEFQHALANAAAKGIEVQILISKTPNEPAALTKLIAIKKLKKLYVHAKVFIIDDSLAAIGSINLTRTSLDQNRELAVITQNPTVMKQLNNTFDRDWNQS